jgi:hypothetical protein
VKIRDADSRTVKNKAVYAERFGGRPLDTLKTANAVGMSGR